ncbi:MAG: GH3 auxin-responsive promoter family protein [Puia sp.]
MKRILDITGKNNILEVWPSLELYIHGGVSFTPYREQFAKIIGGHINYLEMYNASEGFLLPRILRRRGHVIIYKPRHIYGIYARWRIRKTDPQTIGLKDVELGVNYALIISTKWRSLALSFGGHYSIHKIGSLSDKSEWQAQTFYQCLWRRIDRG